MEFLHELCQEEEIERETKKLKRIRMVIVNIQSEMVELASTYNENVNNDSVGLKHLLIKGEEWMDMSQRERHSQFGIECLVYSCLVYSSDYLIWSSLV